MTFPKFLEILLFLFSEWPIAFKFEIVYSSKMGT